MHYRHGRGQDGTPADRIDFDDLAEQMGRPVWLPRGERLRGWTIATIDGGVDHVTIYTATSAGQIRATVTATQAHNPHSHQTIIENTASANRLDADLTPPSIARDVLISVQGRPTPAQVISTGQIDVLISEDEVSSRYVSTAAPTGSELPDLVAAEGTWSPPPTTS